MNRLLLQRSNLKELECNTCKFAPLVSPFDYGIDWRSSAYRKYDRGLSGLKLDGLSTYTIDLYDNSGYTQPEQVIWQSPVLPYGEHSITLYQLGPDARFGVYPYLISETWVVIYPTDIRELHFIHF